MSLSETQTGLSLGTRALAIEGCFEDNDKWIRVDENRVAAEKQNGRRLRAVLLISLLSVVSLSGSTYARKTEGDLFLDTVHHLRRTWFSF